MRVWYIRPQYLDQKRLYAAHNEIHTCLSCIKAGRRWGKFPTVYQHSLHTLKENHENLVEEMAVRQHQKCEALEIKIIIATHLSPFPRVFNEEETNQEINPTQEDYITDIKQLREKWESERYYHGLGSQDLRDLEIQYGIQPGPSYQECQAIQRETRSYLRDNPNWFKDYKEFHPKSQLRERIQAFRSGLTPPISTISPKSRASHHREEIKQPELYTGPLREHHTPPDIPDA